MYCSKQLKNLIIFHQVVGILITTWLLKQVLSIAMLNPDIEILSLNCMSSSQEIVVVHDCMVDMFSEVLQPPNAQNRAVGEGQMIKKTIQATGDSTTPDLHLTPTCSPQHTVPPHPRPKLHYTGGPSLSSQHNHHKSHFRLLFCCQPQPVGSNGCWQGHQTCSVA